MGIIDLYCCKYYHLPSNFFIQISIIHDSISSRVADKKRSGFGQWMGSTIIHDNICKLIHKKRPPKSYHNNKYHMTLNIIFSVAVGSRKLLWSTVIGLFSVILYGSHFPNSHHQAPSPSEWPMIIIFPKSLNESLF